MRVQPPPLGVLAGGRGIRLTGGTASKALYPVCGKPLISYILDAGLAAGVTECFVAVRRDDQEVVDYLSKRSRDFDHMRLVYADCDGTGPAALHLTRAMGGAAHMMATADLVIGPRSFASAISQFQDLPTSAAGLLAITNRIGLDKPVWVEVKGEIVVDYGKDIDPQTRAWASFRIVNETYADWVLANTNVRQDTKVTQSYVHANPDHPLVATIDDSLFDVDTPEEIPVDLSGRLD